MGYGSYSSADWSRLRSSRKISETSTANDIFESKTIDPRFNPLYVDKRESFDSEDHPNSTPVIIGLDVTGSMGYLSAEIAKNGLNETMQQIYSTKPISDPHLLFAAIGDVRDRAPLQVTQFEADIRIAEQLLALWLEGNGGDGPEDFQLLWYFAAKHTKIDAYEKRGKKGFLFTIGDADIHPYLNSVDIKGIFGDVSQNYSSKELYKMASEKYEVFHIHLARNEQNPNPSEFTSTMPGRILTLARENVKLIPELIISTMELVNGKDLSEVLAQWPELDRPIVERAVSDLTVKSGKKGFFF